MKFKVHIGFYKLNHFTQLATRWSQRDQHVRITFVTRMMMETFSTNDLRFYDDVLLLDVRIMLREVVCWCK